jgi:hypothetical protein
MRRRRPIEKWSFADVARSFEACLTSHPDERYVRAAYVQYIDLKRLPKSFEDVARRQFEAEGEEFTGIKPFMLFLLDFDDEDRVEVFMDDNAPALIREWQPFDSMDEARSRAHEWVTEGGRKPGDWLAFDHTPGLYQAALLGALTGRVVEPAEWNIMWILPSSNPDVVMVRRYPPRTEEATARQAAATEAGEAEDDIGDGFYLLPAAVADALQKHKYK